MYKTSAVNSKSAVSLVTSPCEPDHVYSGLQAGQAERKKAAVIIMT
jgi:hypothetical protein